MAYEVVDDQIIWGVRGSLKDMHYPTLAELLEAAKKEFPDVPLDQLEIDTEGLNAEVVILQKK